MANQLINWGILQFVEHVLVSEMATPYWYLVMPHNDLNVVHIKPENGNNSTSYEQDSRNEKQVNNYLSQILRLKNDNINELNKKFYN